MTWLSEILHIMGLLSAVCDIGPMTRCAASLVFP